MLDTQEKFNIMMVFVFAVMLISSTFSITHAVVNREREYMITYVGQDRWGQTHLRTADILRHRSIYNPTAMKSVIDFLKEEEGYENLVITNIEKI